MDHDHIPPGSGSGFSMSVPAILFFGIVSVIGVFVVIAALVSSIHRYVGCLDTGICRLSHFLKNVTLSCPTGGMLP